MADFVVDALSERHVPRAIPLSDLADFAARAGRSIAPNLWDLLSGAPAPPVADVPEMTSTGKIPSTDDPRFGPAYGEFGVLLSNFMPVGGPTGGLAAAAVPMAARMARGAKPATRLGESLFDYSRLRNVPDVPQYNLERYVPPRGIPERTQALADPANIARVNDVVKRVLAGRLEWYNTEPLREAFISELGRARGIRAYEQYLDLVAATSPRSKVGVNARNASYYYSQAQQGQPVPSVPLPPPYGHIAQRLHIQNAENVLNNGGLPVVQNPKPASIPANLQGNQLPVTIDTHNARPVGHEGHARPANRYAGENGIWLPRAFAAAGGPETRHDAGPVSSIGLDWRRPRTGLRSSADPFLKVLEDRISITAHKKGLSKPEVLRRFIRGEMPLLQRSRRGRSRSAPAPAREE